MDGEEADPIPHHFIVAKIYDTPKGKKRYFFYKVTLGENSYPAVIGPMDLLPGRLHSKATYSLVDTDTPFDAVSWHRQMDELEQSLQGLHKE